MIIKDTQKLLPTQILEKWQMPDMVLEVPCHGIPLHPKSVEKLLTIGKSRNQVIAFRPILPIASELGLPPYPVLAYLYPQEFSHIWDQLRQRFESQNQGNLFEQIPFTLISETGIDEQLHYFVEHYGKAVKPSYVRVIVGNTCNLKCVMCPYHSPLLKPTHSTDFFKGNKAMSWEMMTRLARECGEAKTPILIGNVEEPLLHPHLVDFIQLCRQEGVPSINLTTNGQLLDESRAKALLEAGLTSIDISLDAVEADTYFQIRGANLNRVESNVINFIQLRDKLSIPCEVKTSFVRNKGVSLEEEEKFRERWLSAADGIFILNLTEYQQTNMRLGSINQGVQNLIQHYMQKSQGRWTCLSPFTEMAVLPDGRIYYCIETLFRLGFDKDIESLGDYNQQTLQDIWCGDLFNKLRRDLILNQLEDRPVCKNCDMWMSQAASRFSQNGFQITTTMVTQMYQKEKSY